MIILTKITATNAIGLSVAFDDTLRIVNGLDLSGLQASVNTVETTHAIRSYQNTQLEQRNFDLLVHMMKRNMTEAMMDLRREEMHRVFNPEFNPIRFEFENTAGEQYYLTAYATSTPSMPTDKANNHGAFQRMMVQFTCPDPYIYQAVSSRVDIATWIANFEFDLEIPEEGIELEYRSPSLIQNVYYGGSDETGVNIRFKANGEVVNPGLINLSKPTVKNGVAGYETLKLNFTMQTGDVIEVSTYKGKRSITLIRNNQRTNIFYTFIVAESKFLTLRPGDNQMRYEATSGEEYLDVSIEYSVRKVGI